LAEFVGMDSKDSSLYNEVPTETLENLIKNMVIQRMILDASKDTDIENRSQFKMKLLAAKNELIQKEFINDIMKKAVTPQSLDKAYADLKETLAKKNEYYLKHILTSNKKDAEIAYKELQNGEPFNEIATKRSVDVTKQNGGDLGWMMEDQIPNPIETALTTIQKGQYTKPVETRFGWHVVYLEDKRKVVIPSISEARSTLEAKIGQDAVQEYISKVVQNADIVYNLKTDEQPKNNS
jgi:peptidyl-prolyl cis-trans isomerase C